MTALACIFVGKLEGVRSPPPTPSATEKTDTQEEQRTKDKQEKRKKNFPTKTTTAGRCGSLWHLLLMDGCLQLFCALRTRHHPQPRLAQPGTRTQHQRMDGTDGVGRPARPPLPRPLLPATSASFGGLRRLSPSPPTVFAKDRRPEAVLARTARAVGGGGAREPPGAGPAGDTRAHTGTLGPPGGSRVQPPPRPSGPPSPCGPLWKDTSLYAICPHPHPRHERPRSSRPSGLRSHTESYQHFDRGGGAGEPHAEAPGGGRCRI